MTKPRTTPKLSLQEYTKAIEQGWAEEDLGRAIRRLGSPKSSSRTATKWRS